MLDVDFTGCFSAKLTDGKTIVIVVNNAKPIVEWVRNLHKSLLSIFT
jgi:hypothetical protein